LQENQSKKRKPVKIHANEEINALVAGIIVYQAFPEMH
jgi:hypothetical protein